MGYISVQRSSQMIRPKFAAREPSDPFDAVFDGCVVQNLDSGRWLEYAPRIS
ncbi:unnamed protein product [Cylicocyclus nassatus]|uniref:Uncharacterized protein n=1 Tax=Cylicocyclus nassatus TaxID=53992 RepID=A0AA36HG63_CYLNA|nr:unnamed protein product [Cylicocyclus nassatus]